MEELKPCQNKVKRVAYTQQFPATEEGEMYESPITVFERNICNKLTEEKENLVIAAVHEVCVTVDKEELEKALRYDRQQYEKGYADAKQAAIYALAAAMPSLTTPDGCGQFDHDIQVTDEAYVDCMQIIHDLSSAQPERKTGKWYFDKNTFLVRCSACGVGKWKGYCPTVDEAYSWMKFCPNCGAYMREKNDG